ncbi:MAG TPA: hypothetical protein VMM13_09070, partial [Euzebya sp.]|nr:hypothetical protein [Euzebya sp.]
LTLVITIGATAIVDRQITDARLRTEAQMLLARDLDVLAQLVADMRSDETAGGRRRRRGPPRPTPTGPALTS